jgi:16S rRNA G966 N2-methylase RsmD
MIGVLILHMIVSSNECNNWVLSPQAQVGEEQVKEMKHYIRANSNVLVWGMGYDTQMLKDMSCRGRVVFIETNTKWYNLIKHQTNAEAYQIEMEKRLFDANKKFMSLTSKNATLDTWLDVSTLLPMNVSRTRWDVIIIDGPPASNPHTEGRHHAIYTTRKMVHKGTIVFLDDCERNHEAFFASRFLKPNPNAVVRRKKRHAVWGNSRCTYKF